MKNNETVVRASTSNEPPIVCELGQFPFDKREGKDQWFKRQFAGDVQPQISRRPSVEVLQLRRLALEPHVLGKSMP